jgi:CheY-like chemotaxis protein
MPHRSRQGQCVVLLVEDDADTYELYSEVLASAGFSVIGADNGTDAIHQALQHEPDLVVMDYELRGMDGVAATELLKHDPRTREIPVMMLTGHVARRQIDRARAAGCDAFLSKPCPIHQLLDEVGRLVDTDPHKAFDELILVVEDDDAIRESIMQLLDAQGYRVTGATNGRGALHYLRKAPVLPGLILLDLMMPVMDGWTFRTQQLADPRLADIPVVILSATNDPAHHAAELHVDEYLQKPLDVPRLLGIVDRHSADLRNR